ncbi:hypothetical protein GCM10009530_38730 [Microbispora corallina]|uniref:SnoaL-like domain-containing protein n=1 Tax=Microbispora corallina TaxID=83302 RepID=A0ABQ4G2N3_9ACTN|nr:nuclear transport factor 2 family protein [Microbispora corallina]GIH41321.1 hypothetical protein Mco01_43210 [Microbispora corallina]
MTEAEVRRLVREWYEALDRHDPVEKVAVFLANEGLVMKFPEGTLHGLDDFRGWYDTVINRFFDEVHELKAVDVTPAGPGQADVRVVVNWQARIWDRPAPRSAWLGFDATQTWSVVSEDGAVRIRSYVVDALDPMPGSASL